FGDGRAISLEPFDAGDAGGLPGGERGIVDQVHRCQATGPERGVDRRQHRMARSEDVEHAPVLEGTGDQPGGPFELLGLLLGAVDQLEHGAAVGVDGGDGLSFLEAEVSWRVTGPSLVVAGSRPPARASPRPASSSVGGSCSWSAPASVLRNSCSANSPPTAASGRRVSCGSRSVAPAAGALSTSPPAASRSPSRAWSSPPP